jgi:hypothetical protein
LACCTASIERQRIVSIAFFSAGVIESVIEYLPNKNGTDVKAALYQKREIKEAGGVSPRQ